MIEREFICVVGNQRCGKSVWAKAWCRPKARLFVVDPMGSYPSVNFDTPPDEYLEPIMDQKLRAFRVGTYLPEELPLYAMATQATANCSLIIEECGLMFLKGERLPQYLKGLVFTGGHPHINVDLVLVAQRAVSIPPDIRSQAQRIVSFRQTDPADVDAICERIGRDWANELTQLPKLHCLDWSAETGKVRTYMIHP